MNKRIVIIIGGGPAGLTAAEELLQHSDVKPIILETENFVGGISRTFNYRGNRMDMGGHRFFSKSDRVMDWWLARMPMQGSPSCDDLALQRQLPLSDSPNAADPERQDLVMLFRQRLSRIYYLRKFFPYPVSLSPETLINLGPVRLARIGASYLRSMLLPKRREDTLEDFMINRFGTELYRTFFADYTEKVWGVPCSRIPADWGRQRIKGVSIGNVIRQALRKPFHRDASLRQKNTETSLIGQFIYPKFGPGQFWEEVARRVVAGGGEILTGRRVDRINFTDGRIVSVETVSADNRREIFTGDFFISSMPIRELIAGMNTTIPDSVREVASGLRYRAFRTVGLLVDRLAINNRTRIKTLNRLIPDTWIYIQERDVRLGRLQIFNNWSPYMVKDWEHTVWVGLEYFCDEDDEIWNRSDDLMIGFAADELAKIGIVRRDAVRDGCSVRVPKAYPAYFGTYGRFNEVRAFLDRIPNLYPVGRNGMHRYNNMDHSMLTAMTAVENIVNGIESKDNLWAVNAEQEYHEEKNG